MLEAARELDRSGQSELALEAYRRFLKAEPGSAMGWGDYSGLLMVLGRLDEARRACDEALRLGPGLVGTQVNSACIHMHQGDLDEAERLLRQILVSEPGSNDARWALSECLVRQGTLDDAKLVLAEMIEREPGNLPAHQMLGQIFHRLGQWEDYQREIERRLSVEPSCSYVEYEQGYLGLLSGDLPAAWSKYESRWRVPRLTKPERAFRQPRWKGERFEGQTLLLHYEQGFGDTVMLVRYARMVKALGGRVLLEAQPQLADLMSTCPGIDEIIPHGNALPPFDLQLPLLSLPWVFQTTLGSIPANIPYLDIPAHVPNQGWIVRVLAAAEQFTRIGLVWSGNAAHKNDRVRSIQAEALRPLASLPNVFWFGLQPGSEEEPPLKEFVSLAPWLSNFSDTAYALSGMDLVITVDTAVAHLSGALGIPTLLMLPYSPDWRWLLDRDDSPWYPSMRLYRQPSPGDWDGVIQAVVRDLGAPV